MCSMQANVLEDNQEWPSEGFFWGPVFNCGTQLQCVDSLWPPSGGLSSVGGDHQCGRRCH
jgi:hypothetical protein